MFCLNCGKEISDNAAFCKFCGTSMSDAVEISSVSSESAVTQKTLDVEEEKEAKLTVSDVVIFILVAIVVLIVLDAFFKFVIPWIGYFWDVYIMGRIPDPY